MPVVKVPKWVQNKLLDREKVIAIWWHFYATDKRLIRYNRKSDYGILDYDKISITSKKINAWLPAFSVIMGLILFFVMNISSPYSSVIIPFWMPWLILICFIGSGILAAMSNKYYQFRSPDFSKKEHKKWLIPKEKKTDRFIETIKKQSGVSIEK